MTTKNYSITTSHLQIAVKKATFTGSLFSLQQLKGSKLFNYMALGVINSKSQSSVAKVEHNQPRINPKLLV